MLTFYFKEIYVPLTAPVNISLDLAVKPQRQASAQGLWIPVEINASLTNESNKFLKINKSHWVATALSLRDRLRVRGAPETQETVVSKSAFQKDVNQQMALSDKFQNLPNDGASSRFQRSEDPWDTVGFGPLFNQDEIRPKEKVVARRIVYVPLASEVDKRRYQLLKVRVSIPSYIKQSDGAEDTRIRVLGGLQEGANDHQFVITTFCLAERSAAEAGLSWFFDKFSLPISRYREGSAIAVEPVESVYCPTPMRPEVKEHYGAQVYMGITELDLDSVRDSL